MKKTKAEKGITLIALIITIVVLLILAAVAISSIQNDGILHYAKNAADNWNKAVQNEANMLGDYLNYLNNSNNTGSTSAAWTQNGTTVTNGKDTLTVGDYVNYVSGVAGYDEDINDDGVNDGWQVLGADNGQLLLLSANYVVEEYELYGVDSFVNGISKLNGQYADSSKTRSIKVDDINRITRYNPMDTGSGAPYGDNTLREYGIEVTYTWVPYEESEDEGEIHATGSNGATGTDEGSEGVPFEMFDERGELSETNPIKVTNTYYSYNITDILGTSSPAGPMLYGDHLKRVYQDYNNNEHIWYYLASTYESNNFGYYPVAGIMGVSGDEVTAQTEWDPTVDAQGIGGIRAVVYLQPNVTLTRTGTNPWTLS